MSFKQDNVFINRVLNGEVSSFSFLVDKYKRMALAIALKVVANKSDAEDIVQESFIKAFLQLNKFEKKSNFSTWLYTIVYRTALYDRRKNQIKIQAINDDITQNHRTINDDSLKKQEQKKFLKIAISKLTPSESLIVTLFYHEGKPISEIKDITNLSKANIKVKLTRSRKKIKRELTILLGDEMKNLL